MDMDLAHAPSQTLHGVDQLFGFVAESRLGSKWEVAVIARGSRTLGLLRRAGTEKCAIFVPDAGGMPEPFTGGAVFYAYRNVAWPAIALGAIGSFHRDMTVVATKLL